MHIVRGTAERGSALLSRRQALEKDSGYVPCQKNEAPLSGLLRADLPILLFQMARRIESLLHSLVGGHPDRNFRCIGIGI